MQEQIPKIERSVAYTFDAYSGGLQIEGSGGLLDLRQAEIHNTIFINNFLHIAQTKDGNDRRV